MTTFTPIRHGPAQLPPHDSQQPGAQKNATHSEPSKGSHADHSIYQTQKRVPAWIKNVSRMTPLNNAATPFHNASEAPHISLLKSPVDQKKFARLLIKLGDLAVKCASTTLTDEDRESAYRDINDASKLNNQCRDNLQKDTPSKIVENIHTTMKILSSLLDAVERNKDKISTVLALLPGAGKR